MGIILLCDKKIVEIEGCLDIVRTPCTVNNGLGVVGMLEVIGGLAFMGWGWWDCTKCHKRDGIKKISEEIKIFKRDGMLIKKGGALKQCLVGVLRSPYEL